MVHVVLHHNRGPRVQRARPSLGSLVMATTRLCVLGFASGSLLLSIGCKAQPTADAPLKPAPTMVAAKPAKPAATAPAKPTPAPAASPAPTAAPTIAAAAPLAAEKFTAHTARQMTYDEQRGDHTGTVIVLQDALPDCHCAGKSWWVRYYDTDTKGTPRREVHLTIDASGYIAETEEIDRVDKVEVVYTPALVLVPDKLPAKSSGNAAYAQEVKMVVHPLGDRSKIKAHGTARNEITFEGDEPIVSGVDPQTAHRLTCTVTANLAAAITVDTTEQWLVDGIGIAMQRDREETRVMGAKVRDNSSTMILRAFDASK